MRIVQPCLADALRDWGTEQFSTTLKREVEALDNRGLPLEGSTQAGGLIDWQGLSVSVIDSREAGPGIEARIDVFFTEVVGGCNCGDEPYTVPGYCQLQVTIDRQTGRAGFALIDDAAHTQI